MSSSKSKAPSFAARYREVFALLGSPLKQRDALAEQRIVTAEKRLGIRVPTALREYYLVAGQQKTLNRAYNQLLGPAEWYLYKGKLCFMEENQGVVVWGVNLGRGEPLDTAVYQSPTNEGEPTKWYQDNRKCSAFLMGMLLWQGTFGGGLPHTKSAICSKATRNQLEKNWTFVSENNGMRAYVRAGQAVCYLSWVKTDWCLFAGATTAEGLSAIALDANVKWS